MKYKDLPKKAKIIKGTWLKDEGYGNVWCTIVEINMEMRHMSLKHPKYGVFAWVDISQCLLK